MPISDSERLNEGKGTIIIQLDGEPAYDLLRHIATQIELGFTSGIQPTWDVYPMAIPVDDEDVESARAAIEDLNDKADGDSNDEEIAAGQEVRDQLEKLLDRVSVKIEQPEVDG